VVTNAAGDTSAGSRTWAVTQSNATPGPNVIDLTGVTGTITLAAALPDLIQDVTFTGPGAAQLVVNANGTGRILNIENSHRTVSASGLTLTGATSGPVGGASQMSGVSALTVRNTWITGNSTGQTGGAAYFSGGALTIENSTISNNLAEATENMSWVVRDVVEVLNGRSPTYPVP